MRMRKFFSFLFSQWKGTRRRRNKKNVDHLHRHCVGQRGTPSAVFLFFHNEKYGTKIELCKDDQQPVPTSQLFHTRRLEKWRPRARFPVVKLLLCTWATERARCGDLAQGDAWSGLTFFLGRWRRQSDWQNNCQGTQIYLVRRIFWDHYHGMTRKV